MLICYSSQKKGILSLGSTQGWRFTLRDLSGVASHSKGREVGRAAAALLRKQMAPDGPAELPQVGRETPTHGPHGVIGLGYPGSSQQAMLT